MNATVTHCYPPERDIFGQAIDAGGTSHRARVTIGPAQLTGPASGVAMPDAKATLWIIDHPRPVLIGDRFQLPGGDTLNAIRVESRTLGTRTVIKVYLS